MLRYLPVILEIALTLYALVDCIQTDERRVKNLPKIGWIVLVIVIPIVGPLAWLFAGRDRGEGPRETTWKNPPAVPRRPVAPDDDPEFLAKLKRDAAERERLRKWEEDLRRREQQLKPDEGETSSGLDGPGPGQPTS